MEGFAPLSSANLFEDFCQKKIIDRIAPHFQGLIEDRVTAVRPHRNPDATDDSSTGDEP